MLEYAAVPSAEESIPAGEALLRILQMQGVKAIFSSPGSEWPGLWDALESPANQGEGRLRYYNTRHESLAVAMASGYQKATGELVAVTLHSIVGPLQAAMGIHMARREGVAMVVMSGDSNTWGMNPGFDLGPQWLRVLGETGGTSRVIAPLTKWAEHVGNVWQLGEMVQQACRTAIAPPAGPTYLALSLELLLERIPASAVPTAPLPRFRYPPDPAALDRFAETLVGAKRPVIVTEDAGREPANVKRLVRLAEVLGAGVVEAQQAAYVNFPSNHPLHQGFSATPVVCEADVILVLGSRGPWHPPRAFPTSDQTVLLADDDPAKLNFPLWPFRADDYAGGNLSLIVEGLLSRVEASRPPPDAVAERSEWWAERHRTLHQGWNDEAEAVRDCTPIDPRWLCKAIGDVMPADAVITEEVTTTRTLLLRHLPRSRAGSYAARMTGGLGIGLSVGIGLKVANPDRPVVAIVGDGAFNYNPSVAALGCMQEYGLPILTVIANNGSYSSMQSSHEKYIPEGWAAKSGRWLSGPIQPRPNYALMAQVFGGHGERVEEPNQVQRAFLDALAAVRGGRPAILDVVISDADLRG